MTFARYQDLTGQRFGRLLVVRRDGKKWECQCECGAVTQVIAHSLRSGNTKSCGCLRVIAGQRNRKHGGRATRTYNIWCGMHERCTNPNRTHYSLYGGRGIKVCEQWKDYANFLADMGEAPEGLTLDRIDGNKGYEPGNCRWATVKVQANNTSRNRRLEWSGQTYTLAQLAEMAGIPPQRLADRIDRLGWPLERAMSPDDCRFRGCK